MDSYAAKLRNLLPVFVGEFADVPRYKTGAAMSALCQAIQRAKKPAEVFDAIQTAQVTVPSAMGAVFKHAAKAHRALDQIRTDVFEKLGQVEGEPRAGVATLLRQRTRLFSRATAGGSDAF